MKIYTTPGGQWAGTEKDWKAALKAEGLDPKFYDGRKTIEVPTSKAELMEFLTFYNVNVINPGVCRVVEAASGGPTPPAPSLAAPDLDALRALHNPGAAADIAEVAAVYSEAPTTMSQIVTNTSGQVINLDEIFAAAPIPKQVELAVNLLDRLEAKTRHL